MSAAAAETLTAAETGTLTVVIPVHNERDTIERVLERVRAAPALGLQKELIVVDDRSTDGTREFLQQLPQNGIRCYFHERRRGKGAALRTGFARASGAIVLVQDADLEYDPADYPALIRPIVEDQADVVFSSRWAAGTAHPARYFWHRVGDRLVTWLANTVCRLRLTDIESCYKVFSRRVLGRLRIEENGFGVEPEVVAKVARLGCRIREVPISYTARRFEDGKKFRALDSLRALWCLVRYWYG